MIKESTMGRSEKFEYRVLSDCFVDAKTEDQLDKLGAEGWELVAAVVRDNCPKYVLKRVLKQ